MMVPSESGTLGGVLRYKVSLSNEPPIFGYSTETHHIHEAISPPFL